MPRLGPQFILLLFLFPVVAAQSPVETHQRIRAAYSERNFLGAAAQLRDLQSNEPAAFAANNYDYLLARTLEKTGDVASAMAEYQRVAARGSILRPYALWHSARLARASGNLSLERLYLEELVTFSASSLLEFPASQRLARSWFESGNFDQAIRVIELKSGPGTAPPLDERSAQFRKERAFLADAYLRAGNPEKAKELFTALITNLADPAQPDDFALQAVLGLDALEGGASGLPQLSDYEHLRRASIYQFNRDFTHARSHYTAILNNHPASGIAPDAIFQIGRGYSMQADHAESLKWFERVLEQYPEHPIAAEAVLQTASAYARVGKYRESVARYKRYIEKYPEGPRIDRAYLNIIDVLRDQREETEALKWVATIRDKFRGKQPEALATFAEARIHFARTNWEQALASLDKLQSMPDLGGVTAPGGTTPVEVRFLRAFALEQLRRYPEAVDGYLSIPDGRNEYHGWRATERLRLMAGQADAKELVAARFASLKALKPSEPDAHRRMLQAAIRLTDSPEELKRLFDTLRTVYAAMPAYKAPEFKLLLPGREQPVDAKQTPAVEAKRSVADELLFLGLYDEAAPELELRSRNASRQGSGPKTDLDYTLAVMYTRGDLAHRGSAFIESAWKIPPDYQLELIPGFALDLLYPAAYARELIAHAPQRSVDPRFLLAIMRQESRFRADVKSNAAARGLMQFISTTASRVAAELKREDFQQDDLYDPSTAILFGSHYTGNLFKLFPNEPEAVAASYNGGEDNMRRWLNRAKSDAPDRYVPEIAFSQSKDYVWRVMANYRVYRSLFDENLKRR